MKHLNHFVFSLLCLLLSANYLKAQDTSWYNEGRTIFTLTTADQLIGLRDLVNSGTSFDGKIIKLGNDIDLSSTNWSYSIGYKDTRSFSGTFDGCNHTINYKCSYSGSTYTYFGLFGHCRGDITRLIVKGSINISSSSSNLYVGGICGYVREGGCRECINEVNINVSYTGSSLPYLYVGGICGRCSGKSVLFSACTNKGRIETTNGTYIGGICGDCFGSYFGSGIDSPSILYCENTNDISSTANMAKGSTSAFVGGLIGRAGYCKFKLCRNTGNISASGTSLSYAGGLLGLRNYNVSFEQCYVACQFISARYGSSSNRSGQICGGPYNSDYISMICCYANSDCSLTNSNGSWKYCDSTYSLEQMKTIAYVNKLNETGMGWIGGDGVFPVVLCSKYVTEHYSTFSEPTMISFKDELIDMPIDGRVETDFSVLPLGSYQDLSWESSNTNVVEVDEDGVLWGISEGNAVITATSTRNNVVTASFNVHVGTRELKQIILPDTVKVHLGDELPLEISRFPSYAYCSFAYESADENVATVSSEKIKGLSVGETTITVKDQWTGVQASCNVVVYLELGDTFKSDIPNDAGTVSTTFMLTDLENRYVSIGDGTNAAIATATTGSIVIQESIVDPGNLTYTVTSVGNKAFASSNISSVTIPQGISNIGDNAFNGCSNLTSVTVEWSEPLTINSTCFSNASNATLNVPKGCYEAYSAAENWRNFKSIVEPPHIEGDLFNASVTAGSDKTDMCFRVIDAENKYVSVGNGEEAAIPDYTSGKVVVPSTVTSYDGQTYQVKELSTGAFFSCYEMSSVELPDGITAIPQAAFYGCSALTTVAIPTSATQIGDDAFSGCSSLASINLPAKLTSIGVGAFYDCSSLTSVTIPSSVTAIGEEAFSGCSKLTSVTVQCKNPIAIDGNCFTNASNATLNVPSKTFEIYSASDNWKEFKVIKEPKHSSGASFAASISVGGGIEDARFVVSNTTSYYVGIGDGTNTSINNSASGSVMIPSSVKGYDGYTYTVTQISAYSFYGCNGITSVVIPDNVTTIGAKAFKGCSKLSKIRIPVKVATIGSEAFAECGQLQSVTVEWMLPLMINDECFSNVENVTLYVPYGTKARYEKADGWKLFGNIVEMEAKAGDIFMAQTADGLDLTFEVTSGEDKTCQVYNGNPNAIDIVESSTVAQCNVPFGNDYHYSTVQMPYTPSEIGRAGKINSIAFKVAYASSLATSLVEVYLGHKSDRFSNARDCVASDKLTRVYSGSPTLGQMAGWEEIVFNEGEFDYNGTDNLVVVVTRKSNKYNGSLTYSGTSGTGMSIYRRSDGEQSYADVTNTSNYSISNYRPIIKIAFDAPVTQGLVTIPNNINTFSVTGIKTGAFYNMSELTDVSIPNTVTTIEAKAFDGCYNLTSVTVGWDEPITIGGDCFSNAENATLYVPIETNYDYSIATGWKDFGQIANKTNSVLLAGDVIVCRGGQITLPIMLSNKDIIRSIQFELALPEGISVVTNEKGELVGASLSERAKATHIIKGTSETNGNYRVMIMPEGITDAIIQGSEGLIATIKLKVPLNVVPNDYDIKMTACELSIDDGESRSAILQDVHSKLTASSVLLGDIKDNGEVSVTDVQNLIDYILHKKVSNFTMHAADINGDGIISVSDISILIDILLRKTVFGEKQALKPEELPQ